MKKVLIKIGFAEEETPVMEYEDERLKGEGYFLRRGDEFTEILIKTLFEQAYAEIHHPTAALALLTLARDIKYSISDSKKV